MPSSRIQKLQGYAHHLRDGFLQLREAYSMLDRMLFDPQVAKQWASGKKEKGFNIIQRQLVLACVQDIAKLSFDSSSRVPSIRNFVQALDDQSLKDELRAHHSHIEVTPEVEYVLERNELRGKTRRIFLMIAENHLRKEFDLRYDQLVTIWSTFSSSVKLQSFIKIRNKRTAHTDIQCVDSKYELLDIGSLQLKWIDIKETIDTLQQLVSLVELLVELAKFPWNEMGLRLNEVSTEFWKTENDR